jgi:NAD(P)-dependent dehydrogenase (short-subunit alcohol dehydrogenase family)
MPALGAVQQQQWHVKLRGKGYRDHGREQWPGRKHGASAGQLTARGGRALGVRADVTNRTDVEALVKAAIDAYDRVDVIVNNAGACRLRQ